MGEDKEGLYSRLSKEDAAMLESFLQAFNKTLSDKLGGKKLSLCLEDSDSGTIPASIFSKDLGITESAVKYLRENRGYTFSEIAGVLKKTRNNVSVTYSKAVKKHPGRFEDKGSGENIPLDIFSEDRTTMESICLYLKDRMTLKEIGRLLGRDPRSIWTVWKNAKAKGGVR